MDSSCTRSRESIGNVESMKMSFESLKAITDDFSEERFLGRGAFGKVYKGALANGKEIAVKVLNDMAALDEKNFTNEFQNLARLKHRNIVQLVGYCNESEEQIFQLHDGTKINATKLHVALCLEYVDNGSLHDHISDENQGFEWHIRYQIIKGICLGLEHLREGLESPVWHLDLKPDNILLDKEMKPKIADFGLSRLIGDNITRKTMNSVGTRGYWPPEYLRFQLLSEAFDIFSLGVIITKIMIGNDGYNNCADMLPRKFIKHVHNNWKKKLQETVKPGALELYCQQVKTCIEMASKCLNEKRKLRPIIKEIVVALSETETMIPYTPLQTEKEGDGEATSYTKNRLNRPYTMEKYTYESLKEITDNFSKGRLLGGGGIGRVYKGVSKDGEDIAVKVLKWFPHVDSKQFQKEIENMAMLQHDNIIQFVGYCHETEIVRLQHEGQTVIAEELHTAVCFEYLQNGSLECYISDETVGLDWCTRYKIIRGTCDGLRYLHEVMENPIGHLNLKPSNILLDENMLPRVTDFGLSRLLGEEAMRTIRSWGAKMEYLPPEFITKNIIHREFDIYSLGIIIMKVVAGHCIRGETPHEFTELVVGKWRKRLQATSKVQPLDGYCQQVKKCIEIALKCVEADRHKRPIIGEIVRYLDQSEALVDDNGRHGEARRSNYTNKGSNGQYATPSCLPYKFLKEITNNFSDDRLLGTGGFGRVYKGVCDDGKVIAVKVFTYIDDISDRVQREIKKMAMLQHENIIQLVGYCDETEMVAVPYNGKIVMAEKVYTALCFEYLQNRSLQYYITDESNIGLDWCTRYKIIRGTCDGLRYLHEVLENPIWHLNLKPSKILLDVNMVPKISGFTLSRLVGKEGTMHTSSCTGTIGYLPPEFIEKQVISTKFDIFSLGVIMIKMVAGMSAYSMWETTSSHEFIELVVGKWRNRLQSTLKGRALEGYCQQVKKCMEIAFKCTETDRHKRPIIGDVVHMLDETENVIHGAGKLLDVHPMELQFAIKPNKYASCLLQLCNMENDDHVAFKCWSKSPKKYLTKLPLYGIVPPRCTYTLALMTNKQSQRPLTSDRNEDIELQSIAVSYQQASAIRDYDTFFSKVEEIDADEVQELTLKSVCAPQYEEASTTTQPQIKIMTTPDARKVSSIEVHPKNPWLMTIHEGGNLRIWNYQTMAILSNLIKVPDESVQVAKFIAQDEWIVAGDGNGCIHVLSYDESQEDMWFEAHNGQILSLAVHPTDSYVLSSSHDDHIIKLWYWDQYWDFQKGGWVCTRTFEGHTHKVSQVLFNQDNCSFASASWDGTVKIWNFSSGVCNTTLDGHPDGLLCVDYITGADRQHLITGSKDGNAQIWDLGIKRCREYLEGHANHISVVYSNHEHQKLFTGSLDGTIRIWDSTTNRLENIIAFNLGAVSDLGYIEELQRIVVGCHQGIAMMEVKFS